MSTSYEIFKDIRLIIVRSSGPANPEELIDMITSLYADPDFSDSYDALWDARGRTVPFTLEGIRKVTRYMPLNKGTGRPKRALLVSRVVHYGIAIVFERYRHGMSNVEMEIFHDREEALTWLGLQDHPLFLSGRYSE